MSQKLDEIRKTIDALDNQIHDLLMERADLIIGVTEEKKKNNIPVVQPAREAIMIRRLLARHRGPLPEAAIIGIWRELVGAVSLLQTGLKVSVSAGQSDSFCWDMAKNYFGTVLPMVRATNALMAISSVRENDSNFAVVPWPQDGDRAPWWQFLVNQKEDRMRIVCALPYGSTEKQLSAIRDRALIISKTDFAPSGQDHSFIALEIDSTVSRAKIQEVFKSADLELLTLNTMSGGGPGGKNLHFIEVNDYIGEKDTQLERVAEKFSGHNARCVALGGYPVPPVFKAAKTESKSEKKTGT
ncbi:MAG: chorismate mutase [Alphaproteobacteria bacterium]